MQNPEGGSTTAGGGPEQPLHTPEEAAELLNLTRNWLIVNARAGKIPHRRFGRKLYRFSDQDIAEIKEMFASPVTAETVPDTGRKSA